MRLFHVFPILSLLFGARASSLDSRQPDAHPLDARDVTDVCGDVGKLVVPKAQGGNTVVGKIGQLNVPLSKPILKVLTVIIILIDSCLCLSELPQFLVSNPVAIEGVALVGAQVVTAVLTNLVRRKATVLATVPLYKCA